MYLIYEGLRKQLTMPSTENEQVFHISRGEEKEEQGTYIAINYLRWGKLGHNRNELV